MLAQHRRAQGLDAEPVVARQARGVGHQRGDAQQRRLGAALVVEFGAGVSEASVRLHVGREDLDGLFECRAAAREGAVAQRGHATVEPALRRGGCGGEPVGDLPAPCKGPGRGEGDEGQRRARSREPARLGHGRCGRQGIRARPHPRRDHADGTEELLGRLEPRLGCLRQQASTQGVVLRCQARDDRRGRRRLDGDDLHARVERRASLECAAAREALVEHRAERKQVAPRVDGAMLDLFGRHVGRRAQQRMGLGELRPRRGGLAVPVARRDAGGDAEVEQFHVAVGGDDDVVGLQVAVDDAVPVGRRKRLRDLRAVRQGFERGEAAAFEDGGERLALGVLHDDEAAAVGVGADFVDRADARMVERRDGLGLAQQALVGPRVERGRR